MIPLRFALFWSGAPLSYLRYLTFKSLRYFHPESRIQLYLSDTCDNTECAWNNEKQDFQQNTHGEDYLDKLDVLDVEKIKYFGAEGYPSNFQSDIFRWDWLRGGGFYLDTDQIILRSFNNLPLDYDFIYSGYKANSCGYYTPVGVLGASTDSEIVDVISRNIEKFIDTTDYNSAGPFMLRRILQFKTWRDKMFNSPSNYFYPIPESYMVSKIYDGTLKLTDESYAIHEFLGHPKSQEFNKKYTEEFARQSNDTISVFMREKGII